MLHAVNTQHGLQRIGPSAIARLGIKRLDDSGHILPWQNMLHAGEENLFSGLTALSAEFTIGEGELMAHDVPLGCAPDEYDDLISGTCSHLPYLKRYLENRVNNLYILPFNGCGNIKKIFDFLQVPFSDSQENKEIKGKVMCLIDTDDKNVIRIDGYKKSNYKNKLGFFRLSLNNDESGLISIASTMGINTEIEDLLDPAIFWDVLHKIKEQDEILHEFLSFYKLNEEMDFVNLSGGVAFLKPTSIEGYEKKEEFYEYLTSQRMKSLISNMYVKDLNNLRVRKCDKWLTDIIDFFENGDEQNIME